ncbi:MULTISPECIES: glycosyltransferase family 61 protein [Aphanothece]|uniref:glycosyltransferase family 61 protein n=1 Tax=Aphanothece TaxID=1121 RepID=UPI0039853B4A
MNLRIIGTMRDMDLNLITDATYYYRNDPNSLPIRHKWIAIDSHLLPAPLRSAAEPRLGIDLEATRQEIQEAPANNHTRLPGRALITSDHWLAGNICHVLFDHLYRHWLAEQMGFRADHVLVIGESWKWLRFVAEEVLKISNIVYVEPRQAYHCKQLYFFSNSFPEDPSLPAETRILKHPCNRADRDYLLHLRRCFQDFGKEVKPGEKPKSKKLFISRQQGSLRSFSNLRSIEGYFRINGFDVTYMEDHSPAEQILAMRGRTHIAGLHGAGLTNFIGADHGTKLLEIYSDNGTAVYRKIALALDHPYSELDNRLQEQPRLLDLSRLEASLGAFLSGQHKRLPKAILIGTSKNSFSALEARLRSSGHRTWRCKAPKLVRALSIRSDKLEKNHVIFVTVAVAERAELIATIQRLAKPDFPIRTRRIRDRLPRWTRQWRLERDLAWLCRQGFVL